MPDFIAHKTIIDSYLHNPSVEYKQTVIKKLHEIIANNKCRFFYVAKYIIDKTHEVYTINEEQKRQDVISIIYSLYRLQYGDVKRQTHMQLMTIVCIIMSHNTHHFPGDIWLSLEPDIMLVAKYSDSYIVARIDGNPATKLSISINDTTNKVERVQVRIIYPENTLS